MAKASFNLIGGEKGGVGKSVMARLVAQYFIDRDLPFVGFDTDRSHATFRRFYADFASPVVVDDFASLDAVAEAAVAAPDRQILVDLAAQTLAPLQRWCEDSGLFELLGEAGLPVRFWHVMDDGMDSVAMLERLVTTFGRSVSYVVVLNHGRGADFAAFHASAAKRLALDHQATIIELRRLHEGSMRKIDLHDASFWAAINVRSGDQQLGLLERQRVKIWLGRVYEDLDRVFGATAQRAIAQGAAGG